MTSEKEAHTHNTGFASGGVTCKPKVYCILLTLLPADSFVLRNPPLRKAVNRYAVLKK